MPILIDENNTIVAGHARVMAAKRSGLEDVPCIVMSNLSKEQVRAYVIADNKLAESSSWDTETLLAELVDLRKLGIDTIATGFEDAELEKLLADAPALPERGETLRPLKWARILLSIPNDSTVHGLDETVRAVLDAGGTVDYAGN